MTPDVQGFRMPAEWEHHEATWLTWPHDGRHWPGHFEHIPAVWARMVKEFEDGEDVHIFIHDNATKRSAEEAMKSAGVKGERVYLHHAPNNFSWARDHGPIFLKNGKGERMITDWRYNAWGEQWEYDKDDVLPQEASRITGVPFVEIPMVLEGGSIDVNGKGTLLTTESCLLNPNRNPELSKEDIENNLKKYLGVSRILWLKEGIAGDDTAGHVDDLTRFVGPSTVVTVVSEDKNDIDYKPLKANLERLHKMEDQDGTPLTIITISQPAPVFVSDENGNPFRIPASYANFYIGNTVILLPVWNDPNDAQAIAVLEKYFPDRRVCPIDSRVLTWGLGSFHCVTQQMPS